MSEANIKLKIEKKIKNFKIENVKVRRANLNDLDGIFDVALSVGKKTKDALQGYLMDDYSSNPKQYKEKLLKSIKETDHFYVAEYYETSFKKIVGFMICYSKEKWLKDNPDWIEANYFKPDFKESNLDNFIMLDKVAVQASLNRKGIGSKLAARLTKSLREEGIYDIFEEVIVAPTPNLPSILFKAKRGFKLASVRYEEHQGKVLTTLVYHRSIRLIQAK